MRLQELEATLIDRAVDQGGPGRGEDARRDPVPFVAEAIALLKEQSTTELIWASPRELLNIFQAEEVGCHIITVTHDVLKKLEIVGKNLSQYSLETVQMFRRDAQTAGYTIATG